MWYIFFPISCTSFTNCLSAVFTCVALCTKANILVNTKTIPVLTSNTWFIHIIKRKKKSSVASLFINVFRDLKTVHFKPEVTTGHYATTGIPKQHLHYFAKLSKIHHRKQNVSPIMFNSNRSPGRGRILQSLITNRDLNKNMIDNSRENKSPSNLTYKV